MNLLEGITIIDFTRLLPGPVATHILAQMGARVVKIESPKRMDPTRKGIPEMDEASVLYHQLNHNKEFRIIDYNTPEGKTEVYKLAETADVVMESFRPGAMGAWGLGYGDLAKVNPGLVYLSMTGYGQKGEYSREAGHDFNYLSLSGIMSLLKDENGKPTLPDIQIADISGAYMAIIALQSALIKKMKTGKGCYLDVSLCDAVLPFLAVPLSFHSSNLDYRMFNVINGKTAVNYAAYQCSDGKWISLAALEVRFWNNFCDVAGKPEWKRKHQLELMNFNFDKAAVEAHFKLKTRDEWAGIFKGSDTCVTPILEIEELENHPYHMAKGSFEKFETPSGTALSTIALPFTFLR